MTGEYLMFISFHIEEPSTKIIFYKNCEIQNEEFQNIDDIKKIAKERVMKLQEEGHFNNVDLTLDKIELSKVNENSGSKFYTSPTKINTIAKLYKNLNDAEAISIKVVFPNYHLTENMTNTI